MDKNTLILVSTFLVLSFGLMATKVIQGGKLESEIEQETYEGQIHRLHVELGAVYNQVNELYAKIDSMVIDAQTPRGRREMEIEYYLSQTIVTLSLDSIEVCLQDPIFGFTKCKRAEEIYSDSISIVYR